MQIRISWENGELIGTLDDTATGKKLAEALPHTASASTWGEEVYFSLPVETELEDDATDVVEPGTICYWVQGRSLALPYGPTPASQGSECRLVTAVNVLGRIEGDPREFASLRDGDSVTVSLVGA